MGLYQGPSQKCCPPLSHLLPRLLQPSQGAEATKLLQHSAQTLQAPFILAKMSFLWGKASLSGLSLLSLAFLLTLQAPSLKAVRALCGREAGGVQFYHQSYLIAYAINVILLLKILKSIQWLAQDNYGF